MKSFKVFIVSILSAFFIALIAFQMPTIHRSYIRGIAEESVVQIYGLDGTGTGSHVELEDGSVVILTNKHICEMKGPLKVKAEGSSFYVTRKIIKISKEHDLCAIEALDGRKGIKLGSDPVFGDELYTLGHPRGDALNVSKGEYFDNKVIQMGVEVQEDGTCLEGTLTEQASFFGTITYCLVTMNTIQFSSPTYQGNSGSPVINKYGNLVSVVFAGNPQVENNGHGVPLLYVKEFLSGL